MVVDDAILEEINPILSKNVAVFNNMVEFGVGLLTERLDRLVALAGKLGIDDSDNLVVAANNSLTDNDALAEALKWKCTFQLYENIAAGIDYFSGENEFETDSLDLSGYIKNPEMYIWTDSVYTGGSSPNVAANTFSNFCPGWNDESTGGWTIHLADNNKGGSDLLATLNSPVANAVMKTWASKTNVYQEFTGLPVGKYTIYTRSSNQNPDTEDNPMTVKLEEVLYIIIDGDSVATPWDPRHGQWFGFGVKELTSSMTDIEITDPNSVIRIGLSYDSRDNAENTFINAFNIFMTGTVSGFDYANSIDEELVTPKEVKDVQFYSINGMLLKTAQKGLNIQKVTYSDGTVKINKIFVK